MHAFASVFNKDDNVEHEGTGRIANGTEINGNYHTQGGSKIQIA